jgi:hypothetical protein
MLLPMHVRQCSAVAHTGVAVGPSVGSELGWNDGEFVGAVVGSRLGLVLGIAVGSAVGRAEVGVLEGAAQNNSHARFCVFKRPLRSHLLLLRTRRQ